MNHLSQKYNAKIDQNDLEKAGYTGLVRFSDV